MRGENNMFENSETNKHCRDKKNYDLASEMN